MVIAINLLRMKQYVILALTCIATLNQVFSQGFDLKGSGLTITFDTFNGRLRNRLMFPDNYKGNINLGQMNRESDLEVSLHLTGYDHDSHTGSKLTGCQPGQDLRLDNRSEEAIPGGKRHILTLTDPKGILKVESCYEFYDGASTVRRYTKVTNTGKTSVGIQFLSSAMVNNIGVPGNMPLNDKLTFFRGDNGWKAEGRWLELSPLQMGYGSSGEFQLSAATITNTGSMSTVAFLPMGIVHDKELGLSWFWQIEHNGSWHWEFSDVRAPGIKHHSHYQAPTYMYIGGPDEPHHTAWKELAPGEVYTSVPVAVGCVEGSFDNAVAALTRYRRVACITPHSDNVNVPVIFNDYMNCLMGNPTTEKEIPLIDAAAKAGCDYFVIDAGWYAEINKAWWSEVGEWMPSKTRWQPGGLIEVLDMIRQKGMIPGLWLEIERVGINSPLASKPDNWFFTRHGKRVIVHNSYQLDFSNPEVCKFADGVVDRIVGEYKAGYIKMDYNINIGLGTERGIESAGQGLLRHQCAYLNWLKNIYKRYPDLVIENCGSGGCRMDYAMLSLNQIQSSSDQTDYRKYPAILAGAMASVLPEQLAVWSYPQSEASVDEAAFNMVSAMLCRIHQSGHLANLPEANLKQVQKGIEVYKQYISPHISKSVPFYPLGLPQITDNISPVALGIRDEKTEFIAVWRLSGPETVIIQAAGDVELLYPTDLGINLFSGQGVCSVDFPRPNMACILKITHK